MQEAGERVDAVSASATRALLGTPLSGALPMAAHSSAIARSAGRAVRPRSSASSATMRSS
jgi:hypothetical protein